MLASRLLVALVAISCTFAHPINQGGRERILGRTPSAEPINQGGRERILGRTQSAKRAVVESGGDDFSVLVDGNKRFRDRMAAEDSGLLQRLSDDGQVPQFMFLGCSDSRVSEGTIFSANPGTLFTSRNIANVFTQTDSSVHSVLSYAVSVLGVEHVIVMGHYGCGGVAAAIASPPSGLVESAFGEVNNWIAPIRHQFETSTRAEIVDMRNRLAGQTNIPEPEIQDPGFRALVEENVKASVKNIAASTIMTNHNHKLALNATGAVERRAEGAAPLVEVYVHGFVYDIENGEIHDLGVSVGPPGAPIPAVPFSAVSSAAAQVSSHGSPVALNNEAVGHEAPGTSHEAPVGHEVQVRCESLCKAKRAFSKMW